MGASISAYITNYVNAGNPDVTFGNILNTYYTANPGSSAGDRALVDFYFQSLFATSAAADVNELSVYYYSGSTTTAATAMSFANTVGPLISSNYFYVADGYGQRALVEKEREKKRVRLTFPFDKAWQLSRLTSKTTIVNNAVVTGISLGAGGTSVSVITASQTYTADYVICTVTLGNLKNGDITFTPALPAAYTAAIGRMGEKSVLHTINFDMLDLITQALATLIR